MEKPKSNFILNCRIRLVNNYPEKYFFMMENNSKMLSILPNDVRLRIHTIAQIEKDLVVAKNTAIYSLENTRNKFHIQSNLHSVYKKNVYYDKQYEINTLLL